MSQSQHQRDSIKTDYSNTMTKVFAVVAFFLFALALGSHLIDKAKAKPVITQTEAQP